DQALLDGIAAGREDDRNRRGSCLGKVRALGVRDDHRYAASNDVGNNGLEPGVVVLGGIELDGDVLALDKAGLRETLAERLHHVLDRLERGTSDEGDHRRLSWRSARS